jgi:PAS domain S-box-containing protein
MATLSPKSGEAAPQSGGGAMLWQRVLGSVSAEVAVLDHEGTIVMTNDSWERFARENAAGQFQNLGLGANYLEVCRSASGESAEGAKDVLKGLEEVLSRKRRDFSFEYPCHSSAVRRWFLLQATGTNYAPYEAVLLHIDITDRKLLEQRLHDQEERFRVALENSPVVVFIQDRELRYTWINSPVMAWAAQEYIGRTDADILGAEEGERLMAIKRGVLESGVRTRVETPVTFNGETRYFDLNISPMRDEVGTTVGITCACTDITAMKRSAAERERLIQELGDAQRELTKRNLELEALNTQRSQWLGMAAHDLRNPLSSILVNCELLEDELTGTGGKSMEAVRSIQACGQFILQLLDDVLDISAIEAGVQRFVEEPTDLRSLIEEAIALSRPIANRKNTHIEARFPEHIPVLTVDRQKVIQVLLNLIGNALKFSQSGAKIQLTVVDQPTNVLISVRDNGPGIPPEELGSMFVAFQRGKRVSGQPGTGLGLAISQRIVERHGGRIWAENAIDGGAVVHVSLPRLDKLNVPKRLT